MIESVAGVILAGGKSTRMGKNKALLPYRDRYLIDAPIEILNGIFSRVFLSVRNQDDFAEYGLPKIPDLHPDIGPIGGITSILKAGISRAFCVACDMPYLNEAFIQYLCSLSDFDVVIPVWKGREEMLHAVYSESLLAGFEASIAAKKYKLRDALGAARVHFVTEEAIGQFDPSGKMFQNVNTPSDYEKL
ncbi:molybdenum cofactor guanylyltransferase [bacterium]|nr:molybdenum cofactor guanylyltransferase [bacterium]MCI0604753.1 molybdenum cofactor guanylyltransferase [bacterium]